MRILSNSESLFTQRHLGQSNQGIAVSLQRLSSGLRINSAKDDAAGLAISERMTAQIRGLDQARRNANDGISLLRTAEGAMGNVTESLQRIRVLAVQAANSTNSASDKAALQQEVNQLLQNIDRVGAHTEFNGQQLFSQSRAAIGGDPDKRAVLNSLQDWAGASVERIKEYFGLQGDGVELKVDLYEDVAGGTLASVSYTGSDAQGHSLNLSLNIDMADFVPANPPNGGKAPMYNDRIIAHEMVHAVMGRTMNFTPLPKWFKEGAAEIIHGADERVTGDLFGSANIAGNLATISSAFDNDDVSGSPGYSAGYLALRFMEQSMGVKKVMTELSGGASLSEAINTASGGAYADEAAFKAAVSNAMALIDTSTQATALDTLKSTFGVDLLNEDVGAIGGADANGGTSYTAESIIPDSGTFFGFEFKMPDIGGGTGQNEFMLNVGPNAGQYITAGIGAMNAGALGVSMVDLTTNPSSAIRAVDTALDYVNLQRARMGALESRMETTITRLMHASENTSAAQSRILDTDFASETAELTRRTILQNTAMAMTTQANAVPQLALMLLR